MGDKYSVGALVGHEEEQAKSTVHATGFKVAMNAMLKNKTNAFETFENILRSSICKYRATDRYMYVSGVDISHNQ